MKTEVKDNFFKKTKIFHVYEYFDEPYLYSFSNETNSLFLADLVDYDEQRDMQVWIFLPISMKRLIKLEKGDLSLRDAFQKPESPQMYLTHEGVETSAHYNYICDSQIFKKNEDWLPDADYFIEYESDELEEQFDEPSSEVMGLPYVDLSIEPDKEKHEIEAIQLANLLKSFQNLFSEIYQKFGGSARLEHLSTLNVTKAFSGSFGVRLVPNHAVSLFDDEDDPFYRSSHQTLNLIKETTLVGLTDISKEKTKKIVKKYNWNILNKLKNFSDSLPQNKNGKMAISFLSTGNTNKVVKTQFNSLTMSKFVNSIQTAALTNDVSNLKISNGEIISYNSKNNRVAIMDQESKITYSKVFNESLSQIFTVPSVGEAKLRITKTIDRLAETNDADSRKQKIELIYWKQVETKK